MLVSVSGNLLVGDAGFWRAAFEVYVCGLDELKKPYKYLKKMSHDISLSVKYLTVFCFDPFP